MAGWWLVTVGYLSDTEKRQVEEEWKFHQMGRNYFGHEEIMELSVVQLPIAQSIAIDFKRQNTKTLMTAKTFNSDEST